MHAGRMGALLFTAWMLATGAIGAQPPIQPFPTLIAADVTGQTHRTDEHIGRRVLVVAITERGAADAMRAWYAAAASRIPPGVAELSILSLHIPFFVSTAYARSRAREEVPEQYWHDTLLDRGDMAAALGLRASATPYVYAIDEHGRVLARVHLETTAPGAQVIWKTLSGPP